MRESGILLAISSLPSEYGIGCFSREAYEFADRLSEAGQSYWQILPLGPVGYGDSPYQSFSTFAGNPYYISPETLVEKGWITEADCREAGLSSDPRGVDYVLQYQRRYELLRKAYRNSRIEENEKFRAFTEKTEWLPDYALFMALKEENGGRPWYEWEDPLRLRDPEALAAARERLEEGIGFCSFLQFEFYEEWMQLKDYVNRKGIRIIGDIPIYVSLDSSDVWADPELFQLDENGVPTAVAGVPPDYFSATGQLWGNPLYNWDAMKADKYRWWIDRIDACLELVDYIRIDHFRGFEAYWAVPFGAPTAEKGEWLPGPDHHFFEAVQRALLKKNSEYAKGLPIIAEDLGVITPQVERLRDDFHLPGMKILQFAFSAAEVREVGFTDAFLPHRYTQNAVVYTGTHDNTTLRAWLDTLSRDDFEVLLFYLYGERPVAELLDELFSAEHTEARNSTSEPTEHIATRHGTADAASPAADDGTALQMSAFKDDLCAELIKQAFFSVAVFAVIPFQDLYALGAEARMNEPSTLGKNWTWRMPRGLLTPECAEWLSDLVTASGRCGHNG